MPTAGDAFLGSGGLPISHNPLQRINFSPPKIRATLDDIIDLVVNWVEQQLFPAIKKITGIDLGVFIPAIDRVKTNLELLFGILDSGTGPFDKIAAGVYLIENVLGPTGLLARIDSLIEVVTGIVGSDLAKLQTFFQNFRAFLGALDLNATDFAPSATLSRILAFFKPTFPKEFPFAFGDDAGDGNPLADFVSLTQFQQLLDGLVNDGANGHSPAHAIAAVRAELAKARADVAQAIQDGIHFGNQDTGIAQALQNISLQNLLSMLNNGSFKDDFQALFDTGTGNFIGQLDNRAKIFANRIDALFNELGVKYGALPDISVGGLETDIEAAAQAVLDKLGGKVNALLADAESRLANIAKAGDALAVGVWKDATKLATTIGGELTTVEDGMKGFVDHVNASVGVAAGQTINTIEDALSNFPGGNIVHDFGLDGNVAHGQLWDAVCNAFGLPGSGHGISDVQTAAAGINRQLNELINGKKAVLTIIAEAGSGNYDPAVVAPFLVDGDLIYPVTLGGGSGGAGGSGLLHGVGGHAGAWSSTSVTPLVRGTDWHAGDTFDWVVGVGGAGGTIPGGTSSPGGSSSITLHGGSLIASAAGGSSVTGTSGVSAAWWGDGVSPTTNTVDGTPITAGLAQKVAGHGGHSSGGAGAGGNTGFSPSPGGDGASGLVAFLAVQA